MTVNVKGKFVIDDTADLDTQQIGIKGTGSKSLIWKDADGTVHEAVDTSSDVESVNGQTGVVVLGTDDIADTATNRYTDDTDIARLANTSGTNTGDMSDADVKTAYENNADTNAFTDAEKTAVATNSAKVSNATHTGDATGSTALTVEGARNITIQDTMPADELGNNYQLTNKWYQNLLKQSEDISQSEWGKSRCTIDGTTGIVANTENNAHGISVAIDPQDTCTISFDAMPGDKDYVNVFIFTSGETNALFYYGLSTLTTSTIASPVEDAKIVDIGNGYYRCYLQITRSLISSLFIQAATSLSNTNFAGDGVTVDVRFTNIQLYKGTIFDNYPYIQTTTTAETGKQEYTPEPSTGSNKLVRLDGTIEVPQDGQVYYAKDQSKGRGETVYYQQWSGTDMLTDLNTVAISGFNKEIATGGFVETSGGVQYPFPWADAFSADLAKIESGTFTIGSSWQGNYEIWAEYK